MTGESLDRAGGRSRLYGRFKGRPLRASKKRALQALLPELTIPLPQGGARLDQSSLFGPELSEYWLEIGFGGGEHLAWQAAHQVELKSGVGLIGVEFYLNGIAAFLRQIEGTEAVNRVRLYQGDARDLLAVLPERSLERVFILFPDPWPKKRHHKRRLLQTAVLDRLAELMRSGAELRIATDDRDYLRWILGGLQSHSEFNWTAKEPSDWQDRPEDWPQTRYEQKALAAGRRGVFLRYIRV